MSAEARPPGGRSTGRLASRLTSVIDVALRGHTERETEILRQLTDVFGELKRLSAETSALEQGISETNARLEQLIGTVEASIETHVQTTQLLGRLLESARGRLEVLEEALNGAK